MAAFQIYVKAPGKKSFEDAGINYYFFGEDEQKAEAEALARCKWLNDTWKRHKYIVVKIS